eukprot:TRINITY_DN2116_c0_g1_i1.p1 TRINITY_DN2116_c0_g1~~TRINITY_DN2116_c0_g1_i1.p1  ORF type:complete len:189 (+),score=36.89 TRINITY_DN2116_c0_g1_i1:46-612(+)
MSETAYLVGQQQQQQQYGGQPQPYMQPQQQYAQPCTAYGEQPVVGVPLYTTPGGAPPQNATAAVVVVENETDDFVPACIGTGCFGILGLCCFACFCNTPTGRVGASTGCIFYGSILCITYAVILILFTSEGCDDDSNSGGVCDTFFGDSRGRLIVNIVISIVIIAAAIALRIKYVRELNTPVTIVQYE